MNFRFLVLLVNNSYGMDVWTKKGWHSHFYRHGKMRLHVRAQHFRLKRLSPTEAANQSSLFTLVYRG
jgi:hypothetical protein